MNRNKKVGYTYYGKGGARHTGITNNPKRRRTEHNKATGGDGFLKVQTGPMSKANAKRWESGQRNTRGYAISQRTLRGRKAATAPRSARRRAFQDAATPLTRRVDSHQLVGPHLTTAKRDARRPRGIEYVSVRIHHAPQSNGARVFGALEFDCAVRMPSTCAASINGSSSPADLDHTSDEFKTIIQEHYRRTPSLRKLADIHGVSRSTVHRIVQAQ